MENREICSCLKGAKSIAEKPNLVSPLVVTPEYMKIDRFFCRHKWRQKAPNQQLPQVATQVSTLVSTEVLKKSINLDFFSIQWLYRPTIGGEEGDAEAGIFRATLPITHPHGCLAHVTFLTGILAAHTKYESMVDKTSYVIKALIESNGNWNSLGNYARFNAIVLGY